MGIIRFLLALAVVADHSHPILGFRMITGPCAVEIFFLISGFYMSLILRGKYSQHQHSALLFYGNRFLRLYPTYLFCLMLYWMVFFGEYHFLHRPPNNAWMTPYQQMNWIEKFPLIFANWSMVGLDLFQLVHYRAGQGFVWFAQSGVTSLADGSLNGGAFLTFPQAWSIGLEIWFYLMAPFLLRKSWLVLACALAVSIAFKGFFEHGLHYNTYFFFPAQCCFFLVGALVHRAYEHFSVAEWPPLAGQIGLPIIVAGTLTCGWFPIPAFKYVFYPAFCLFLPLIFAYTRKSIADRHLGNLSYPIYMVHLLAQNVLQATFRLTSGNAIALASIAMATVIYICLEIPIDSFRQGWLQRSAPAPEPVGT